MKCLYPKENELCGVNVNVKDYTIEIDSRPNVTIPLCPKHRKEFE